LQAFGLEKKQGAILTPYEILERKKSSKEEPNSMAQVVDNKRMGDRGLEPLTSTVCRKRRKKIKYRK
jgi:hypothetical protein